MEGLIVVIWIALSAVAGAVASARGRTGAGWFFIALLLIGPVLALVIICSLDPKNGGYQGGAA